MRPSPAPERLRIGHLEIDVLTLAGAVDRVEALVDGGGGGLVVTPNIDHVVLAERRPDFRAACAGAALSLADGQPIVWASRLLGKRLPERVAGSDLVPPLLERAAQRRWRVFLLGGPPGVAEVAAERLRERGVQVVGTAAPMIRPGPDGSDPEGDAVAQAIARLSPQLLLVGLGAPKQEIWMHRHRATLAPAVVLGVGATIDFLAGRIRRAPRWISRAGLEWLWRLVREPRRLWRRYLVEDPHFLRVLWRTWRERRQQA